jgi:DNA-binding GntR family transcriptional regulator
LDSSLDAASEQIRRGGQPREDLVKRVADALRHQIVTGALPPGTRLIGEVELARRLDISRPTLREAIRVLGREGHLRIRHGVGTFVAEEQKHLDSTLDAMRSMTDLIRSVGGQPGSAGMTIERIAADAEVAAALRLPAEAFVARVGRVRLIDDRPLAIANEYVALGHPKADFAKIARFDGGSLYNFLNKSCGLTLAHSRVTITAVPAEAGSAKLLGTRRGTPLLLLRETHFDPEGRPVLYTVNHHNSEVVEFTLARAGFRA